MDTGKSNRGSYNRFEMYCCSNYSSSRATFTLPNNVEISGYYNNIEYNNYYEGDSYAGCTQFYYSVYYNDYFNLDYTGVHTCNIEDTRGNIIAVNIGLYSEGFNGESIDCSCIVMEIDVYLDR